MKATQFLDKHLPNWQTEWPCHAVFFGGNSVELHAPNRAVCMVDVDEHGVIEVTLDTADGRQMRTTRQTVEAVTAFATGRGEF